MPGHPIPARPDRSRETLQTFVGREAIIQRHRAWIRTVREAIAEFDDEVNEAEVCNRFACKEDIPDRYIIADVGRLERSAEITRDKLSRVLLDWSQRP